MPPRLNEHRPRNEVSASILNILHVPAPLNLTFITPACDPPHWPLFASSNEPPRLCICCFLCRSALPLSSQLQCHLLRETPPFLHLVVYPAFCSLFVLAAPPRLVHPAKFRQSRSRVCTATLHTTRSFKLHEACPEPARWTASTLRNPTVGCQKPQRLRNPPLPPQGSPSTETTLPERWPGPSGAQSARARRGAGPR